MSASDTGSGRTRQFRWKLAVVSLAVLALTGCDPKAMQTEPKREGPAVAPNVVGHEEDKDEGDAKVTAFLRDVKANVPGASAYPNDMLLDMAHNICILGNLQQGVEIMDNYSQIDPDYYATFVISALNTCESR